MSKHLWWLLVVLFLVSLGIGFLVAQALSEALNPWYVVGVMTVSLLLVLLARWP